MYINWYVLCFSVDCPLADSANGQSTDQHNTYQLMYIHSITPDDGLQICPKHKYYVNIYLCLQNARNTLYQDYTSIYSFNVIWRQFHFCWSEFLFFAENFVIEGQNNLESSDKSREILSSFLGRPLEFAKPPNPLKARDGTIVYAGV